MTGIGTIHRRNLISFLFFSLLLCSWMKLLATSSYPRDKVAIPQKEPSATSIDFSIPDFGPDGLSGLTEEQKSKIFSGEVILTASSAVIPNGRTVILAALVFSVPPEKVWSILSATERQVEYLEEIEELKTIEQTADHNRMEFLVRVMGQKVRYTVVHHFVPEKYYFWWELDRSAHNDLKGLYGFWKLYPAGDKTVGRYGSYVRPTFPLPGFLRSMVLRSDIKSTLEKVRKFIESGKK